MVLKVFLNIWFKKRSKTNKEKDFTKTNNDVIIKTPKPLSVISSLLFRDFQELTCGFVKRVITNYLGVTKW